MLRVKRGDAFAGVEKAAQKFFPDIYRSCPNFFSHIDATLRDADTRTQPTFADVEHAVGDPKHPGQDRCNFYFGSVQRASHVDRVVAHIAVGQRQGVQADAAIVECQGQAGIKTVTTQGGACGRWQQCSQCFQLEANHARLGIDRWDAASDRAHFGNRPKMGAGQFSGLFQLERERHRRWIGALVFIKQAQLIHQQSDVLQRENHGLARQGIVANSERPAFHSDFVKLDDRQVAFLGRCIGFTRLFKLLIGGFRSSRWFFRFDQLGQAQPALLVTHQVERHAFQGQFFDDNDITQQ